ncbi:MAG: hypothetical protein ABI140_07245 [Jatrophihabitantaceae bacterium]
MMFRRVVGATAVAAVAAGACLLVSNSAGAASTPPPPTPVSLNATGLSSSACPLPVGSALAFKPGTTLLLKSLLNLNLLAPSQLTLLSEAKTNPPPTKKTYSLTSAGVTISFPNTGIYDITWPAVSVLGVVTATQSAKLIINSNVQKCQVGVSVPVPSVSVPLVPSSVTGPVNGVLSSAANGVNGVLSPVNSAVGGILGNVNGTIGGVTGNLPGVASPGAGVPPGGSVPGTNYHPDGPTVAQRTVPQGYGSGNGAAGLYIPANGGSINAPAIGLIGGKAGAGSTAVKSGGSPKTVDLAANKPRSALEGWSALIVLLAVLALSGATALYARTFLLQPAAARVRA